MRMPEMVSPIVSRFPTAGQRERRLQERDWHGMKYFLHFLIDTSLFQARSRISTFHQQGKHKRVIFDQNYEQSFKRTGVHRTILVGSFVDKILKNLDNYVLRLVDSRPL